MAKAPPISHDDIAALFTYLNRPDPRRCTNTLADTAEFLRSRRLPVEPTLRWLRANGGYCDCEVILNVTDTWGERVGWDAEGGDAEGGDAK
jgi:hypothetical protein